jgi:hypothetical protein
LSNIQGYVVEIQHAENYSKLSAKTFSDVRKILKNPSYQGDGRLSVVRARDQFEIFSGSVQKARVQFGL